MNNRICAVVRNVLLIVLAGIFIGLYAGCDNKKGGVEVIGFPQSFADLSERVKPAVVNISTTATVKIPGNPLRMQLISRGLWQKQR